MSKLVIVKSSPSSQPNIPYITGDETNPILAYKNGRGEVVRLDKGGSPKCELLKCSDLENILGRYFISGTKFILSAYNPVLYYLIPGTFQDQFTPENDFIPTLKISDLARGEVNGFDDKSIQLDDSITQDSVRSIKACDTWNNNPDEAIEAEEAIEREFLKVFGYYVDPESMDIEKEVRKRVGHYSADVTKESIVINPISATTFTDTINLEDWIYASGKGDSEVKGKADVSFMYSLGGKIYGGMQTLEVFRYSLGNIITIDTLIDLGNIQIEYINKILKIYPINEGIDEIMFNDCTLTIGILNE